MILFILQLLFSYNYPYPDNPDFDVYQRRQLLVENKIANNSIYLAFSSDFYNNRETSFKQNSDLFYLTGYPYPKAVLAILKSDNGSKRILFMNIQSDYDKKWNGIKADLDFAKGHFGTKDVRDINELNNFLEEQSQLVQDIKVAPYTKGKHFAPYPNSKVDPMELSIAPIKSIESFNPYIYISVDKKILLELRAQKDEHELKLHQKAIDISSTGHIETIKKAKDLDWEYQAESIMEGTFAYEGAESTGYESIVGSGKNTCILHYNTNREKIQKGDLLLMDCGAEYHGYTADITRTIPVNGKFSNKQKIIYQIVLDAQKAAMKVCKPGIRFSEVDKTAKEFIKAELVKIGLLKKSDDVKRYFPHGTSHYLGLDVHDVGTYQNLKPGNVITIEPGIYIPEGSPCDKKWWNIGVRIEDDILITENGFLNLSEKLPKTIEEIENLMKE